MKEPFTDAVLPAAADAVAPDGSAVRLLVRTRGASMAHFELRPGQVSAAVRHRTVDELWYVLAGSGRMWRRARAGEEREIDLHPGVALTIPVGTAFQFRATGPEPLTVVGVTLPPWPGDDEAVAVPGHW